jgi:hypothetical protein
VLFLATPIFICLTLMALAPYEAWVLFLASTVLGVAANARSSGAFASSQAASGWFRSGGRSCLCLGSWGHPVSRHGNNSHGVSLSPVAAGAGGDGPTGGQVYQKGGRDAGGTGGRYKKVIGAHCAAELSGIEFGAMAGEADDVVDLGRISVGTNARGKAAAARSGKADAPALGGGASRASAAAGTDAEALSRRVSGGSSVSSRSSARASNMGEESGVGEGGRDGAGEDAADRSV